MSILDAYEDIACRRMGDISVDADILRRLVKAARAVEGYAAWARDPGNVRGYMDAMQGIEQAALCLRPTPQ